MPKQAKRKFTRVHYDRQVSLDFFINRYDNYRIKDLNLTGMFVVGHFQQHVGEHCLINLVQKGISSDIQLQASAKVVRTNNEGIAIRFTSMSFDSYMFLQMTLLYEAEQPVAIGLELPDNCPFEIIEQQPAPLTETIHFNYQNTLHNWPQGLSPDIGPALNENRL